MKISVIVPVYNVSRYLDHCIAGLLNQTLKDIEIILVDDGSTDDSGDKCDEYAKIDSRIKVIHKQNEGLGLARNSGLDVAAGEYVGFVDSDDCVSIDMFKILYENAIKNNADISYCSYKKFTSESELNNIRTEKFGLKVWEGESSIRKYMLDRIGLPPKCRQDNLYGASVWCGIFLRERLLQLNAKFVSERQFISEDIIFDIDVIPHCNKIVHCDLPLYYYRYNPNSLTTVYKPDRFEKNLQLYEEMYRRLKGTFSEEELFDSMSRYLLTVSRIAIIQEARFSTVNGKKAAKNKIVQICSCKEICSILKVYQYRKLPWKYALFCFLEKRKRGGLLLFLTKKYYGRQRRR